MDGIKTELHVGMHTIQQTSFVVETISHVDLLKTSMNTTFELMTKSAESFQKSIDVMLKRLYVHEESETKVNINQDQ